MTLESVGAWAGSLTGLPLIQNSQHELEFAGIDFTGTVDYGGYTFVALAEGASLGNPVPVYETVESAIQNGSRVQTERYENREGVQFSLHVVALSATLLAEAERVLFLRCGRRATLVYRHPDGVAPRTRFEAYTSMPTFQYDDMDELRTVRTYSLSLVCDPWGYSDVEVRVDAVESTTVSAATVISDGTSATGWTSPNGTVTSSGGILRVPSAASHASFPKRDGEATDYYYRAEMTRTFSPAISFATTKYVGADVKLPGFSWANVRDVRVFVDGAEVRVLAKETLTDGVRMIWETTDPSATTLRIVADSLNVRVKKGVAPPASLTMGVDNVSRSQSPPTASSTGRESFREVAVYGSAPSPATWEIQHETQTLDETLLYTSPRLGADGYVPDLRRWGAQTGVTFTSDAATVYGTRVTSNNPITFFPPASIFPLGKHLLMVRSSAGVAMTVTATIDMATTTGVQVVAPQTIGAVTMSAGGYVTYAYGYTSLPVAQVDDLTSLVARITLTSNSPTNFLVDQGWLYWMGPDSGLTSVRLGTTARRLRVRTASPDRDAQLIAGNADDWSDAYHPGALVDRWGTHVASPGVTQMHVVTTNAALPRVTLQTRPAWHTFAAKLPDGVVTV